LILSWHTFAHLLEFFSYARRTNTSKT